MKEGVNKIIRWSFLAIYSLITFLYIKNTFEPALYYHLHQPPFVSTWDFFTGYCTYPGGIAQYFANFAAQSFYYNWFGALVILFVVLVITLLITLIINSHDHSEFSSYLVYIPFIFFIVHINNYYFPFVVCIRILIVYTFLWIFDEFTKKGFNYYISIIPLVLVTYYLAGSGALLLFSVSSVIIFLLNKNSLKELLYFLIFAIVITWLTDFFSLNTYSILDQTTFIFHFSLTLKFY